MAGPIATAVSSKLSTAFDPTHLDIINESSNHNVPSGSESHFKVVVVSSSFDGVSLLERHRMINSCLAAELEGASGAPGIHALSIIAKTPDQWAKSGNIHESPPCLGGGQR